MSYLGLSLLICFLVGGTVFFSINILALGIFSRVKLQEAFKTKNKKDFSDRLVENVEKLVLACSLYRFILNISILLLLVTIFIALHQGSLQFSDYLIIVIIAMVLFSVFGVAIPHACTKYASEKILSRTYKLLMFFAYIVWPILYTFQLYDRFVRRLVGISETTPEEEQEEKQEEFLTGLEQHRMEGVVDEEEQEMIENVLELSDTTADEIMTPRTDIVAIDVNSDLNAVLDIFTDVGHSRVPVYENNIDNIVGFVYAKDLLAEIGKSPADFNLRNKMRAAYFVPETKSLRVLLHEFQNQKLHIAVVLDEYGGTAGIVTLEDILEELVGEITDEYEKTSPKPVKVKKIDRNTIEVDARIYIDDLNDEFELNLPEEEDYDTIGGFVFSHLGYIPKASESFDYKNLRFTIASAEARKIKRIRIEKITGQ